MDNNNKIYEKQTVAISGMHCAACARTVEKVVSKVPGIASISVNAMTGQADISYAPDSSPLEEAKKLLVPFGYGLVINEEQDDIFSRWQKIKSVRQEELGKEKKRLILLIPLASLLLLLMLGQIIGSKVSPGFELLPMLWMNSFAFLSSIAVLYLAGRPFLRGLAMFIRGKGASMDTLIGLGTSVAFAYSSLIFLFPGIRMGLSLPEIYFFDVVVIVIAFVYLGKYLEHQTKARAGEAIEKLMGLQAKTALAVRDGQEIEVPIEKLIVGEIIRVKAGEKIPSDGLIVSGRAHIDESMVSGEPIPREKAAGEKVIGGTINQNGSLDIRVSASLADSLLAKVIESVSAAQQSKAPGQKLADRISRIFVPTVIILAFATLASWLLIGPRFLGSEMALGLGLACFISVLAIACPCALGLATPAAIMAGVGAASRKGILIKSAEAVEELAKVDTVVFDKTGTITSGRPTLAALDIIASGYKADEALSIAASLESASTHPIARALSSAASEKGLILHPIDGLEVQAGLGIKGKIAGEDFFIGRAQEDDLRKLSSRLPSSTVIGLYKTDTLIALMQIADTIKPEAATVLGQLKRQGLKTIMLSGDRQSSAEAIAANLEIDEVIGGVSPLDKAEYIKKLKSAGRKVAMIGDGINDSIALAEANVGIAMDTGSDIALESAGVALLRGDLNLLPLSIEIAKRTVRTMKQNLFWAFFYNIIAIPLAAGLFFPPFGWLLSPEVAALAMSFSSVSVISNALALKRRFS